MKKLREMTDDELITERNKARKEGNQKLMLKCMRKLMRRGQGRTN